MISRKCVLGLMVLLLVGFALAGEDVVSKRGSLDVDAEFRDFDALELVGRGAFSNAFYNETSEEYVEVFYPRAVNMKNLDDEFEPYEELTSFVEDDEGLVLSWNGKVVRLKVYVEDDESERRMLGSSKGLKGDLDFETNIKKGQGYYYFDHRLDDKSVGVFGYEVEMEGVDCEVEGYSLVCDEQRIVFDEAVFEQELEVEVEENRVMFFGNDLSYIDPIVENNLDDSGDWGQIEYFEDDDWDFDDEDLTSIGSRDSDTAIIARGFMNFDNIDNIADNAEILDVDLYMYIDSLDDTDCGDGDVDLRFYQLDEEDFDLSPDNDEEMEEIYDAIDDGEGDYYGGIQDLDDDDEDAWISKDLGYNAVQELETLIDGSPTDEFLVGIKVEPEDEYFGDDCHIDFEDTDGDSELPYIVITYVIPDEIVPTTSATAVSGGSSYSFGSVSDEDVAVSLSCSDSDSGCKDDYPRYCVSRTNDCFPDLIYSSAVGVTEGGTSYFRYRSKDNDNNTESIKSKTIIIDRDYTKNVVVNVGGSNVWSGSGYFVGDGFVLNLEDSINNFLGSCEEDSDGNCVVPIVISSDNAGSVNASGLNVYFDATRYLWNTFDLLSLSTYRLRVRVSDGLFNGSWDESESDFAITSIPMVVMQSPDNNISDVDGVVEFSCDVKDNVNLANVTLYGNWGGGWHANETVNVSGKEDSVVFLKKLGDGEYLWSCLVFDNDSQMFFGENHSVLINTSLPLFEFRNNESEVVAEFLGDGGLNLRGSCSVSEDCSASEDSLVFLDFNGSAVAYVDFNGNLCLESGSCSNYGQGSCNPSGDAFVVQDGLGRNLSYVDFDGAFCSTGELREGVL